MSEFNRHDFINNTLRLEILGKLSIDTIESNSKIDAETLKDYVEAVEKQLIFLKSYSTFLDQNVKVY